jgi:heme-degrading monooxygenase HmoA
VIARLWRGATAHADADDYVGYLRRTGRAESRATAGNQGFSILRRHLGQRTEFVTMSLWDSLDAVRGFAGHDVERAVFFPEDDRYLVERDDDVAHYEADDLGAGPVADGELSRVWHGWAEGENADRYEALLRAEVLPGIHRIDGFKGAFLLRREAGGSAFEFVTVTRWESLDAVRAFAGEDHELAVVPLEAQRLLARFDERSAHYETFV